MKIFIDDDIQIDKSLLDDSMLATLKNCSVFLNKSGDAIRQQKCWLDEGCGETVLAVINEVATHININVGYLPQFIGDHLDVRLTQGENDVHNG